MPKKNKKNLPAQTPDQKTLVVSSHAPRTLVIVLAIAFLVNVILYLLTLAPTVTFEDSGELVTAAFNLGVPHPPGYPLFTLLGRIFTFLPFGTIAYRVNLMSAFYSAAAGVFVCWATILLIENTFIRAAFFQKMPLRSRKLLCYSAGICSAILFGTAKETWEQAIITEVYGLNSFFVAVFLFLVLWLSRQSGFSDKRRILFLLSYICGLTLANHTTSLMLLPLLGLYLWLFEKKLLFEWRALVQSFLFFIFGLTPYIYLPVASSRNPVIDWGNPENLTNFIRVITRQQYDLGDHQTIAGFIAQFPFFCSELLVSQWTPMVLLFAGAGLFFLFHRNRPAFYFMLAFLFFTMPVTTWMTNFDITNPAEGTENKALVSVFYIPAYLSCAVLAGIALFRIVTLWQIKKGFYALLTGICLPVAATGLAAFRTMPAVTMRHHTFAHDYCYNLFYSMPRNALYFVNMDAFYFPAVYYQFVENKRPDLIVLNQELLRTSWYITWLQNHYPEFIAHSQKEVDAFLKAVAPFEKRVRYDSEHIENRYIAMINAFIDAKLRANETVYFAYVPDENIMRSSLLEPQFTAYKYTQPPPDLTITDAGLKFSTYRGDNIRNDRMAECVRYYYGNLFTYRGLLLESLGDFTGAVNYFGKARGFFNSNSKNARFIVQKLSAIQ